jgi:hypothetical protein
MGFQCYKTRHSEDGTCYFQRISSLVLSGPGGLLARAVAAQQDTKGDTFVLDAAKAVALVGCSEADSIFLVSQDATGEVPTLARVTAFYFRPGIMQTDVLIEQEMISGFVLESGESGIGKNLRITQVSKPDRLVESLVLRGGYSKLRHRWSLGPAAHGIGAVLRN